MGRKYSLIVIVCLYYSLLSYAQQRTQLNINKIVGSHVLLHKINEQLTLKAKSSEILENYLLQDKTEAFYVYATSNGNEKSFVIVSGDERLPEVLAYSDENDFDIHNIPPAVTYWLNTYTESLQDSSFTEDLNCAEIQSIAKADGVMPLLGGVIWGQSNPYNNLCPNYRGEKTLTGCVATAMAQVMSHYSYPAQANGYVSYTSSSNHLSITHDFSKDNFDWNNMIEAYNNNFTDIQANAVAVLMASCGASVEMDYGTSSQGGSGAYQSDLIKGYIENFGYDKDAALVIRSYCSTADWHRLLVSELNAGRPVNYAGASMRDGGHSFVLDGYRMSNNNYPDYHVNWGWNGSCDGYYQIANLHPQEDGIVATSAPFSESQQMTIGVMPDDGINNNSFVLVSSKLNSSLSKVKRGSSISLNVSSLYNCSYKSFTGQISIALKDEKNQLYIIGNDKKYQLDYLEGTGSLTFSCSLPSQVSLGNYVATLVYKLSDSDNWNEILSSSYPTIVVTENEEEKPIEETWSEIGCSEIEMLSNSDKSIISSNVYEIINLQSDAFIGSLSFTLADENGVPLFSFGENVEVPELGFNDYLTEPLLISGRIEREIPDGHYRLYISSRKKNSEKDSYVVQNNLEILGTPTKELYYRVEIKNGIANIDGKEYEIIPTGIAEVENSSKQFNVVYNLDGQVVQKPTRGIYVINGKKIYICLRVKS